MLTKMSTFKPKKDTLVENKSKRDTNMENIRIVQKNLVFVSGLPASIADADLLKTDEYFGRYGKVTKVVTNPQQPLRKPCSYQAYVTYQHSIDAAIAITALDGFNFQQKPLKVSFGTTKYCAHFLRGYDCLNADCFYLHQYDSKNQVQNKDTKNIFENQNHQAMTIVVENTEEIVKRILISGEQILEQGFPSLMQMINYLVSSQVIEQQELKRLFNKYKDIKIPKLVTVVSSPPSTKTKPDSPKQALKLTKSNSFSTVGSPTKSQTQTQKKSPSQRQKQILQKQIKLQACIQDRQIVEKPQKVSKQQKKQRIAFNIVQKQSQITNQNTKNQTNVSKIQDQIQMTIQKQFLKHVLKLNEKSKSKMHFAGQTQWSQMCKVKQTIQKYLINLN